ncbi:MAG: hypothetical protein NZ533_11545 [Casimicrobiaceae bacterium]|nr:hypothetical protein [Casimicrobiaceae bacterium]
MAKKIIWPCHVWADFTRPDGRRVRMSRIVDGAGGLYGAIQRVIAARKDKGAALRGAMIHAITPLGQRAAVMIDPETGDLIKVDPYVGYDIGPLR